MNKTCLGDNPSRIISDRYILIKSVCTGKDVLDVGCVDHVASEEMNRPLWLHKIIKSVAKSVTGVDFEREEVEKLRAKGYDVIYGDVETVDVGKAFDVIVAGELIEHLSNPGLFLNNMHRHLRDGGIFIVTTPNAFAIRYFFKHLLRGFGTTNAQHTCYFDYYTLRELCSRYSFELIESVYYFDEMKNPIKRFLSTLIVAIRKSFAPGILFVLRKR